MARILGRVEYGNGMPDKFFIHCDTSGLSFTPLFNNSEHAWQAYDRNEDAADLDLAIPARSKEIFAIRKVLAFGRAFEADEIYGTPVFGMATEDRLLWPKTNGGGFEEAESSLLRVDRALHVAEDTDGGFLGRYPRPICKDHWKPGAYEILDFEDVFGQKLILCPDCVTRLV